jgi:pilus assembly protein CpaC
MTPYSASGAPRPESLARAAALILIFIVMVLAPGARAQVLSTAVASGAAPATVSAASTTESEPAEIELLVGRSAVVNIGSNIQRVSLSSPSIADAMVTSQQQLLVHGKAPGTITMFVWNRAGGIQRFEVSVHRDLSTLQQQMKTLFPGEPIRVYGNGKDVVVSGTVSSKYVVEKAAEVAGGYVEKKEDVVNLLKQQEGVATQQVLLRVRFAEVSRSAMSELGVSFFSDGRGGKFGRSTTQQFAAPFFDQGEPMLGKALVFSDYLNLFLFDAKNSLGASIRALQNKGLFQSLAEPNLIAENGKEASFLAGGEYPYPVVQGQSGGQSVTIQFKEFGVKLNFTPTIVGDDLIKLKVKPEVSSLDFANAVTLQGFRVPAISTRRTETEVELQNGQTFAIAGLMNNNVTSQMQKIPGIGDIPILGLLFRSKAAQKNQTELVVMITPTILRRNSTGVSPKLPDIVEPYLGEPKKSLPAPEPWNPGEKPQAAMPPVPEAPPAHDAPRASAPVTVEAQPAPVVVPQAPVPTKAEKAVAERARRDEQEKAEAAAKQAEADRKAAEKQAAAERKAAEKAAKKQAEADAKAAKLKAEEDAKAAKLQARQAEKDREAAERDAKQQSKVEAEVARRQQEAARQQTSSDKQRAAEDKKRGEDLARAEQKLKAAQSEYEQALSPKPQQ